MPVSRSWRIKLFSLEIVSIEGVAMVSSEHRNLTAPLTLPSSVSEVTALAKYILESPMERNSEFEERRDG